MDRLTDRGVVQVAELGHIGDEQRHAQDRVNLVSRRGHHRDHLFNGGAWAIESTFPRTDGRRPCRPRHSPAAGFSTSGYLLSGMASSTRLTLSGLPAGKRTITRRLTPGHPPVGVTSDVDLRDEWGKPKAERLEGNSTN
ncbi:hypothetical protein GCM10010170_078990 [Dactylosporangium salmoneum]|uniref:Uncharacterized protein n=1 Tax=Dactylosporangium salmoneum TaxID=53361 RepID=A0ABP5UBC9_9ACTN